MPRYKNKVGKIIELPQLSGKEMRALKLRRVITVGDIESAGKRKKKAGGMVKTPKKKLATGGFKDAFGMGVGRIKKSVGNIKKAIKPRQTFVGRKAQTMRRKKGMAK